MSYKTLYILRHAKAIPQQDGMDDHERPLDQAGESEARAIGAFMLQSSIMPQMVLCSSSLRTRQTLQELEKVLERPLRTHVSSKLYLAAPKEVVEELFAVPDEVSRVLIIGHNPTLHQLCVDLVESGEDALLDELHQHFPTSALAEISYPAREWSEIGRAAGILKRLVTPASLVNA